MKTVIPRIVSLLLVASLVADPALGACLPAGRAALSQQQSIGRSEDVFAEEALGARLFARNQIRNPASFPIVRSIAIALIASAVPLWAADTTAAHSPQAYVDFAYIHLRWGVGVIVSERVKEYLVKKYHIGSLSRIFTIGGVVTIGNIIVSSAVKIWPQLKFAAEAVIRFFMIHPNLALLFDEGLLIILGLALWQKLSTKKWPRVVSALPLNEKVFKRFAWFRLTGIMNYFVLAYGAYRLHLEIIYYLPIWALATFLLHEFDRRWLGREMRRHLRSDLNTVVALSIQEGDDESTAIVLWEKEPDFLKLGGLLFPCIDYIVPWDGWGPLHERLRNMFRRSSPTRIPVPVAVPFRRLAVLSVGGPQETQEPSTDRSTRTLTPRQYLALISFLYATVAAWCLFGPTTSVLAAAPYLPASITYQLTQTLDQLGTAATLGGLSAVALGSGALSRIGGWGIVPIPVLLGIAIAYLSRRLWQPLAKRDTFLAVISVMAAMALLTQASRLFPDPSVARTITDWLTLIPISAVLAIATAEFYRRTIEINRFRKFVSGRFQLRYVLGAGLGFWITTRFTALPIPIAMLTERHISDHLASGSFISLVALFLAEIIHPIGDYLSGWLAKANVRLEWNGLFDLPDSQILNPTVKQRLAFLIGGPAINILVGLASWAGVHLHGGINPDGLSWSRGLNDLAVWDLAIGIGALLPFYAGAGGGLILRLSWSLFKNWNHQPSAPLNHPLAMKDERSAA
jgi:hypothetical protein